MKHFTSVHLLLLSLLVLSNFSLFAQNQIVEIGQGEKEINVVNISYLEDEAGSIPLEDLSNQSFLPLSGNEETLKTTTEVYWIKFAMKNSSSTDQEWVMDFGSTLWGTIDLYEKNENDGWSAIGKTGRLTPFNSRNYPKAQQGYFVHVFSSGVQNEFLARLDARGVQSFTYGPKVPQLKVLKRSLSDQRDTNRKFWTGVFGAIFLYMFVYHLFVYFSTREQRYLYYLALIFTYFYLTLNNSGYLVSVLAGFENFPFYQDGLAAFVSTLTGIFTFQFTRILLDTKEHLPFWDKVLKIIIIILVVTLVGQFVLKPVFGPLVPLLVLVQYLCLTIVGVLSMIRKIPSGFYYFIAFIFSILGVVYFVLSSVGAVPFPEFGILYGAPLGWTLEILFFAFALVNVINILRKRTEESQSKYIGQLKENELLQTKANRELEAKVKERTVELQHQHDLLKKEKENSDDLLLNILPAATADELKLTGKATPKFYDQVAVLFTDFKDFSLIAEEISADELVEQLDRCFQQFDDFVVQHQLEKIKTIGDSYMCAGGLAENDPDAVLKTVKVALEIKKFMDAWNLERKVAGKRPWEIRIGIHTGPLTSGVVGKKKFAFDIWGDTVNIASRMESTGEPGKVNVSKTTWDLVQNHFEGTYRGKIKAKNKGEIEMFYVERLLSA